MGVGSKGPKRLPTDGGYKMERGMLSSTNEYTTGCPCLPGTVAPAHANRTDTLCAPLFADSGALDMLGEPRWVDAGRTRTISGADNVSRQRELSKGTLTWQTSHKNW